MQKSSSENSVNLTVDDSSRALRAASASTPVSDNASASTFHEPPLNPPFVIVHDFRAAPHQLARVDSIEAAREWFRQNPQFAPVKRAYLCGDAVHKINAVDRFGPFAHQEIAL